MHWRTSRKQTMLSSSLSFWGFLAIPFISLSAVYLWQRQKRPRKCVVLFTRYPQPGTTKTRLTPVLGEHGAAYCQLLMTNHILNRLDNLSYKCNNTIGIDVRYTRGTSHQMKHWLQKRCKTMDIRWKKQASGDLGERLKIAAIDNFQDGQELVVIIGSDIPGITEDILQEAFDRLQADNTDMVLGKAADGGYYLVGFHKNAMKYLDEVFQDIEWGTDKVFKQQVVKAKTIGANLDYLPSILSDVDNKEDVNVVEKEMGVKRSELKSFKWSVVIPVLNEEKNIAATFRIYFNGTKFRCSNCDHIAEIIVSDGGSIDGTVQKVKDIAETVPVKINVVHSKPGRGIQLRTGAAMATGDHFLFVHADVILPQNYDIMASRCLCVPGNVAGAYKFGLDIYHQNDSICKIKTEDISTWFWYQMYLMEWVVDKRCKHRELPWGDQGLFMSRRTYESVGGYKEYRLMEDYIMTENLWKIGHVAIAEGGPIIINSRRYQKHGMFRISGLNFLIVLAYKLGVHPNTLARWYYGDKLKLKSSKQQNQDCD